MTEPELLGDLHFWIGCGAIIAGFAAFASRKGEGVHRKAGTLFVVSMGLLAISGLWLSLARDILFTVFLSAISFHALITGWAAARNRSVLCRWISRLAPIVSGLIVLGAAAGGMIAGASPDGALDGLPPDAFYGLALVSAVLCGLDIFYALMSAPALRMRLTRHLWRMGFSFFLATGIFFFGNNHVLPEVLRTPWFLALPVLAVVVWTAVHAVRTRFGQKFADRAPSIPTL
ncbi:hypothetical protein [Hyphobacterium indicum]|uniref:hypothetical protein n=1 Tax=Hyphobacterium indicum TaxID=2162714 RepID=UPI000D655337|nr:hypothetical protein [Hyphobacterium indicum]